MKMCWGRHLACARRSAWVEKIESRMLLSVSAVKDQTVAPFVHDLSDSTLLNLHYGKQADKPDIMGWHSFDLMLHRNFRRSRRVLVGLTGRGAV